MILIKTDENLNCMISYTNLQESVPLAYLVRLTTVPLAFIVRMTLDTVPYLWTPGLKVPNRISSHCLNFMNFYALCNK